MKINAIAQQLSPIHQQSADSSRCTITHLQFLRLEVQVPQQLELHFKVHRSKIETAEPLLADLIPQSADSSGHKRTAFESQGCRINWYDRQVSILKSNATKREKHLPVDVTRVSTRSSGCRNKPEGYMHCAFFIPSLFNFSKKKKSCVLLHSVW